MSVEEIEARLRARAEEPMPESWIPDKAPATLTGVVRRYEKGTTQGWGDAPICVVESLRNPGRLASIWIFHTTLVNAFQRERPAVGEVIMVTYRGKAEPKGDGMPYHDWQLVVDRPNGGGGLGFDQAFGQTSPSLSAAVVPATGAHVTYEPPADWQTTGNADDRLFEQGERSDTARGAYDGDDIPF
jgi:hypothetical protein